MRSKRGLLGHAVASSSGYGGGGVGPAKQQLLPLQLGGLQLGWCRHKVALLLLHMLWVVRMVEVEEAQGGCAGRGQVV